MSGTAKRGLVAALVTGVILVAVGLYIGLYLINVPGRGGRRRPRPARSSTWHGARVQAEPIPIPPGSRTTRSAPTAPLAAHTTFTLPANTLVHVTVYQFDGQSGLRNGFLSQASGTVGGNFLLNGKPTQAIDPDTASHVFAIPPIGLSVPLEGVADNAKNQCANAPCTLSTAHHTIQFTFRTPGKGLYRWQCFVPCAAGYIQGFGGPMQTVGYMDGFIKVV